MGAVAWGVGVSRYRDQLPSGGQSRGESGGPLTQGAPDIQLGSPFLNANRFAQGRHNGVCLLHWSHLHPETESPKHLRI